MEEPWTACAAEPLPETINDEMAVLSTVIALSSMEIS